MTTPERTVEDEHLAIHMKCLSKSKNARECGDLTVIPMGYAVQMIEEAIQAERQRCEEMVEAERERLAGLIKPRAQKFINKVDKGLARSKETYKDMHYIVDLLNEVTHPNNNK